MQAEADQMVKQVTQVLMYVGSGTGEADVAVLGGQTQALDIILQTFSF